MSHSQCPVSHFLSHFGPFSWDLLNKAIPPGSIPAANDSASAAHDKSGATYDKSGATYDESEATYDESEATYDESESAHDVGGGASDPTTAAFDEKESTHDRGDAPHVPCTRPTKRGVDTGDAGDPAHASGAITADVGVTEKAVGPTTETVRRQTRDASAATSVHRARAPVAHPPSPSGREDNAVRQLPRFRP